MRCQQIFSTKISFNLGIMFAKTILFECRKSYSFFNIYHGQLLVLIFDTAFISGPTILHLPDHVFVHLHNHVYIKNNFKLHTFTLHIP